jgi:hypothetical protein
MIFNLFLLVLSLEEISKVWDRIKCEDGTYKLDIYSILNQHAKCYEKKLENGREGGVKNMWIIY